jgi:hypothetical protein
VEEGGTAAVEEVPSTNEDRGGALLRRTTGAWEMDGGEVAGGEPKAGGVSGFAH